MSSFRVRQLREDDADGVARLFVEAWGESRQMNGDEIREWFHNDSLHPENLLVLVDEHDRAVGYFDVWHEGDSADLDLASPRCGTRRSTTPRTGRARSARNACGPTSSRVTTSASVSPRAATARSAGRGGWRSSSGSRRLPSP